MKNNIYEAIWWFLQVSNKKSWIFSVQVSEQLTFQIRDCCHVGLGFIPVFPGLEESLLHPVFHFSGGELGWSHWLGRDHVGIIISVAGTNRLSLRHWMTNTNRLDTVLCPATCLLQLYCCCSHILVSAVCSSHQLTTKWPDTDLSGFCVFSGNYQDTFIDICSVFREGLTLVYRQENSHDEEHLVQS